MIAKIIQDMKDIGIILIPIYIILFFTILLLSINIYFLRRIIKNKKERIKNFLAEENKETKKEKIKDL